MAAPRPSPDLDLIAPPVGAEDRYAALNDAAAAGRAGLIRFAAGAAAYPDGAGELDPGILAVLEADGSLLVRRWAFESVGGFAEGLLAGAELELCLRLSELGAVDTGGARAPGGAVGRWLGRRSGGKRRRSLRDLWGLIAADNRIAARRSPPERAAGPALAVFTDAYPARSETFIANEVAALRRLGWRVRVESSSRPTRIDLEAAREGRVDYLEDDPPLHGLIELMRLSARHPVRVLADLSGRRRWAAEEAVWPLRSLAAAARRLEAGGERHIHVHFAAGSALHAMRLARLTGIGWSVTGHGYDVFAAPCNLAEKLAEASFVVAPCEYTARHLRSAVPPGDRDAVHVVVMGVDDETFHRSRPYPGGRSVVAVGRLVEKKGFAYLVEAVRKLETTAPVERLVIAGDGPVRRELEAAIEAAGLGDRAAIVDAWGADAVRELLEDADLLAMPAVIAADGDRDAMPVVVKEALAMEVPVVATDEVGLPELVSPEWGRLVAPADPDALAEGIEEVLALPAERRAAMGRAGRAHVLAHCDIDQETAKLARLIERS